MSACGGISQHLDGSSLIGRKRLAERCSAVKPGIAISVTCERLNRSNEDEDAHLRETTSSSDQNERT